MFIFCVFVAFGEGDGASIYEFAFASKSLERCKNHLEFFDREKWTMKSTMNLVHPDMKKENNYTFVGRRDACKPVCDYGCFGGYVIEEVELDKIDAKWLGSKKE